MNAKPAISNVTDIAVHKIPALGNVFPASTSYGQLFVYENVFPGLSVDDSQAPQKRIDLNVQLYFLRPYNHHFETV